MRFTYFSQLMRQSSAIIGNSSAGVREAPFLGVPSLNVGTRQNSRADSHSICHSLASDSERIQYFLNTAWGKRYPSDPAFGNGNAAQKFVDILSTREFWERPLQKAFTNPIKQIITK
jgi:UDP-N-acetylglucosamine 2-epimerase (hydrolysing)